MHKITLVFTRRQNNVCTNEGGMEGGFISAAGVTKHPLIFLLNSHPLINLLSHATATVGEETTREWPHGQSQGVTASRKIEHILCSTTESRIKEHSCTSSTHADT